MVEVVRGEEEDVEGAAAVVAVAMAATVTSPLREAKGLATGDTRSCLRAWAPGLEQRSMG